MKNTSKNNYYKRIILFRWSMKNPSNKMVHEIYKAECNCTDCRSAERFPHFILSL